MRTRKFMKLLISSCQKLRVSAYPYQCKLGSTKSHQEFNYMQPLPAQAKLLIPNKLMAGSGIIAVMPTHVRCCQLILTSIIQCHQVPIGAIPHWTVLTCSDA